jgi:DNA-binding transcriptional regulator YhcF (GntR family)
MTRGLGKIQLYVLRQLGGQARRWWTVRDLAVGRFGDSPTEAQVETVRRAIRALAEAGLIETRAPRPLEVRKGEPLTGLRDSRIVSETKGRIVSETKGLPTTV